MSIRIRYVNGVLVALCAARTEANDGDIYLNDEIHYALSQKYWRDYPEIKTVDKEDRARALTQEVENN